ncbi:hypothetical protein [Marinobacter sp. P4B1]|uniref:hypothetical protein n=1 Tax=Marinobacter sp. P4B1 TaxID=1119533 RepID=UPI00071D5063|nr:hypothetical protein [Marinobacter sp. P4B1]KRW83688.1 hypothetical protein AQ621_16700 [Marinobacter sp. P4B1]
MKKLLLPLLLASSQAVASTVKCEIEATTVHTSASQMEWNLSDRSAVVTMRSGYRYQGKVTRVVDHNAGVKVNIVVDYPSRVNGTDIVEYAFYPLFTPNMERVLAVNYLVEDGRQHLGSFAGISVVNCSS